MTKEELFKEIKDEINRREKERVVRGLSLNALYTILEKIEEKPTDDIPIGAPCEVTENCLSANVPAKRLLYLSMYFKNEPLFCVYKNDIGNELAASKVYDYHPIRPLTIWDIPYEYGGPPEWAIARAYDEYESIWCSNGGDIDSNKDCGYNIERRPEEE